MSDLNQGTRRSVFFPLFQSFVRVYSVPVRDIERSTFSECSCMVKENVSLNHKNPACFLVFCSLRNRKGLHVGVCAHIHI